MIAEKVLGNIKEQPCDKEVVNVSFEWFELEKKRLSKKATDGTAIGVCIPELLKDGDILYETDTAVYVVQVLPCRLIKIKVDTMKEMGRLGFELGNRHLSLEISDGEIKVPFDMPTYEYLKKLGFKVEDVMEQFTDFTVCKAHGHSHSHSHREDQEHDGHYSHGHDNGHGEHHHTHIC